MYVHECVHISMSKFMYMCENMYIYVYIDIFVYM